MAKTTKVDGQQYDLIWVRANEEGRVGVYEEHPAHPGGQAFVTWDAVLPKGELPPPKEVALTPYVNEKLGKRCIVQTDSPAVVARKRKKAVVDPLPVEGEGKE